MQYPLLLHSRIDQGSELLASVRKRAVILALLICVSKSFHSWAIACEPQGRVIAGGAITFVAFLLAAVGTNVLSPESTVSLWLLMIFGLYFYAARLGYGLYTIASTSVHVLPLVAFVCGGRLRGVVCTVMCQSLVLHFWWDTRPIVGAPDPNTLLIGISLSIVFCGAFSWAIQTLSLDLLVVLRKSLEDEKAAAQEQASFLATVCHEIRTPMVGIASLAELLLEERHLQRRTRATTSALPTLAEDLTTITTCSQDLLLLLNDFLDFTKSHAGALELRPSAVSLTDLLDQVTRTFKSTAAAHDTTLAVHAPPATTVVLDILRAKQILGNLVSNALKSTKAGDEISLTAAVSNGTELYLVVADSGEGMDNATRAKLFTPFSTARTGDEQRGSTGLGLSVVQALVTSMNGRIEVTSTAGEGSTFTIVLPLCASFNPQQHSFQTPSERQSTWRKPKANTNCWVLLVEDTMVTQRIVKRQCERLGVSCDVASDGIEAVAKIRENTDTSLYPVILMDMNMPRMDGMSACKAIRQLDEDRGHVRRYIVAFTASVLPSETTTYLSKGLDDVLAKPCSLASLKRCLARAGLLR